MVRAHLYPMVRAINLERSSTKFQFGSTDFTQYTKNLKPCCRVKTKNNNNLSNQFKHEFISMYMSTEPFLVALAPFMDIDNEEYGRYMD